MKEKLDRLLLNGTIHTLKNEQDVVQALGIRDGVIVFTGSDQDALARYQAREVIDLQGRTVIPGLGDSHMHFYAHCQTLTTVDLSDCRSKEEAIERLRKKASYTPAGQWIRGSNFDQSKWSDVEDVLPTRHDLDRANTCHPIVIKRACLHTAVANTAALEKAGIGYQERNVAEYAELARAYGLKQAPSLVVIRGEETRIYVGVAEIKAFLKGQ